MKVQKPLPGNHQREGTAFVEGGNAEKVQTAVWSVQRRGIQMAQN